MQHRIMFYHLQIQLTSYNNIYIFADWVRVCSFAPKGSFIISHDVAYSEFKDVSTTTISIFSDTNSAVVDNNRCPPGQYRYPVVAVYFLPFNLYKTYKSHNIMLIIMIQL